VTSTLCSCLATHAVLQFRYQQKRRHLGFKRWGVYTHHVVDRTHPLVVDVNTRFDVPHSRFNDISYQQFEAAGLYVLVASKEAGVHLAVSEDLFRLVFFQGHPEYDIISLLKEYKREVCRFYRGERADYPPYPENYFTLRSQAILAEYREQVLRARQRGLAMPDLPEGLITAHLDNTWHDTAEAVINNWIGKVYQVTNADRRLPFMDSVDPNDPLAMKEYLIQTELELC
ncbi:MAG: homoserine O-succinyltransferase, partial [Halothiobacillaceae bacterium]